MLCVHVRVTQSTEVTRYIIRIGRQKVVMLTLGTQLSLAVEVATGLLLLFGSTSYIPTGLISLSPL